MKNWKGWLALFVFGISCAFIGMNRYLMKSLNLTVIGMLVISVVLVFLLQSNKEGKEMLEERAD